MGFLFFFSLFTFLLCVCQINLNTMEGFFSQNVVFAQMEEDMYDPFAGEGSQAIADPLEPLNRAFFQFNDKMYFWVLKPTSKVYSWYFPEGVRIHIRSAFRNLLAPVRITNNLLQGKLKPTGIEVSRFVINSSLGLAGLFDPAKDEFGLNPYYEDFGLTLGKYGFGYGVYINWPIWGPSSIRDTIGNIGDAFLNPIYFLTPNYLVSAGIEAGKETNNTSLRIGEYEDFKESALDPYVALRNGYIQHREELVRD